jgi:hypothetical protein
LFLKSCGNKESFVDVAMFYLNYSDIIAKFLQREIPTAMIAPSVLAAFNESNKKSAAKRSSPTKSESEDEDASDPAPLKQKKEETAAT